MKIVGMIRSTASQEVEAEGEDYVAALEQLPASIPRDSSYSTFAGTLSLDPPISVAEGSAF